MEERSMAMRQREMHNRLKELGSVAGVIAGLARGERVAIVSPDEDSAKRFFEQVKGVWERSTESPFPGDLLESTWTGRSTHEQR